jgi:hypothetical protein
MIVQFPKYVCTIKPDGFGNELFTLLLNACLRDFCAPMFVFIVKISGFAIKMDENTLLGTMRI